MSVEEILFYIILVDSITALITSFCGEQWYVKHFRIVSRLFPAAKGWTIYYFALVLWIGCLLYRAGTIF